MGAHCSAIGRRSVDDRVVLDFCLIVSFTLVEQKTLFKWSTRTHESRNNAIFNPSWTTISHLHYPRDLSRYAPSPWETSLHCNDVSHWHGAYRDWSLREYPLSVMFFNTAFSQSNEKYPPPPHISWLLRNSVANALEYVFLAPSHPLSCTKSST